MLEISIIKSANKKDYGTIDFLSKRLFFFEKIKQNKYIIKEFRLKAMQFPKNFKQKVNISRLNTITGFKIIFLNFQDMTCFMRVGI